MGRNKRIVVLAGDGIGPEVVDGAVSVLRAIAARYGHRFDLKPADIGGATIIGSADTAGSAPCRVRKCTHRSSTERSTSSPAWTGSVMVG